MRDDPALLRLLACPACGADLVLTPGTCAPDGHILDGTLARVACARAYPIRAGVPRLVDAPPEGAAASTVEGFGYEWQVGKDVVNNSAMASDALFLEFVAPVTPADIRGKTVLDAGCGGGRFTRAAAGLGAAYVVGVDLSEAVVTAFENTRHLPHVLVVQGDLFALPLRPGAFGWAFSVGVLHHTADPAGAFAAVARTVAPGGGFSAWVYGYENNRWIVHGLNPLRARLTSRLPRPVTRALSLALAAVLWPVLKLVYRPVGRVAALAPLRRVLFYYDYLHWLGQFGFQAVALVIFDHLIPHLAAYIRHDELAGWYAASGLERVVITDRARNSWRGHGVRPAQSLTDAAAPFENTLHEKKGFAP